MIRTFRIAAYGYENQCVCFVCNQIVCINTNHIEKIPYTEIKNENLRKQNGKRRQKIYETKKDQFRAIVINTGSCSCARSTGISNAE